MGRIGGNVGGDSKLRRIGIVGGTFDPPHVGHLLLAETARNELKLDLVLFLPAGQPPHKSDDPVTPVEHRLAMTRLAIVDNPHFAVSTLDIDRPHPHYTATLYPLLQKKFPDSELCLLIGGDSLRDLAAWYKPEQIIEDWRIAVLARPGAELDWVTLERDVPGVHDVVTMLDGPLVSVSSTQIRRWAAHGRSLRYLVANDVLDYIQRKKLYRRARQDSLSSSAGAA